MARVILNGESGDVYTNDTGRVQYQLIVNWSNSCGQCIELDHAISDRSWPIPFHRSCRCRSVAIYPGQESRPFVDFREEVRKLGPAERSKVVGKSALALIEEGVVDWGDVVTRGRIRDLNQIVATKKLTVDAMRGVGIPEAVARKAYESVHTDLHTLDRAQRAELVDKIRRAGATKEELKRAVGAKIARRIAISRPPPPPRPPPAPPGPSPKSGPVAVAAVEEQLGVKFAPDPQDVGRDATVVVDLPRLMAVLAKDPGYHVGPGGTGATKPGAYAAALRFILKAVAEGGTIHQPRVTLDRRGTPVVEDGRHRLAVFAFLRAAFVPVSVPRGQAAAVRGRFGAN